MRYLYNQFSQQDDFPVAYFYRYLMFVLVPVMKLGHMGMGMRLWFMGVLMTVFAGDFTAMMIVMIIVMTVTVFVGFLNVDMRMFMLL